MSEFFPDDDEVLVMVLRGPAEQETASPEASSCYNPALLFPAYYYDRANQVCIIH